MCRKWFTGVLKCLDIDSLQLLEHSTCLGVRVLRPVPSNSWKPNQSLQIPSSVHNMQKNIIFIFMYPIMEKILETTGLMTFPQLLIIFTASCLNPSSYLHNYQVDPAKMPSLGSNSSQIAHYFKDKSLKMANKAFHGLSLCTFQATHLTFTSFPTLTKLNCFQFLQKLTMTLNSRFLHTMLPLSGTPLPTLIIYTQPGQLLLVHKGRNHICSAHHRYLMLVHCFTYTNTGWMCAQMNVFHTGESIISLLLTLVLVFVLF